MIKFFIFRALGTFLVNSSLFIVCEHTTAAPNLGEMNNEITLHVLPYV